MKACQTKMFNLRMTKNHQHQLKDEPNTHWKNLRMLQLLWRMQLQRQCTPLELTPNVYVTEEPAKFHAWEARVFHQEGRESHQVLARGVFT
jgi:hypothetical protein